MFSDELKLSAVWAFVNSLGPVTGSQLLQRHCLWSHDVEGPWILTNTESPIVVVLSESMAPAFHRGDLLFLTNPVNEPYLIGDITVYKIPGDDIPIVHRIIESHYKVNTPLDQQILTKGDNNESDDISLYKGRKWLERHHIIGKVRGFLPYIGYVTIAMNDFPQLKYALLGIMGLFALIQRE